MDFVLRRFLTLVVLCLAALGFPAAAAAADATEAALRALLAAGEPRNIGAAGADLQRALAAFYAARGGEPAWRASERWSPHAAAALRALSAAAEEGLDPARYLAPELNRLDALRTPDEVARGDLLLSAAMLAYVWDVRTGRVEPQRRGAGVHVPPVRIDPAEALRAGLAAGDFAAWLASLPPQQPAYARLRDALARYRGLAAMGDWPRFPDGPSLKPGAEESRVPILRRELARLGDLATAQQDAAARVYDPVLETAVRRFQRRHGLADDGVVGPRTRAALDVSPAQRLGQIIVNMERLRWMPPPDERRYLVVNVPAFDLTVFEDGKPLLRMPVIVGRRQRPTPMFYDRMTEVTFLPSWTAPVKIARQDILPKVKADPEYLERNRIKVFQDWSANACEVDPRSIDWASIRPENLVQKFRQEPGPQNALGTIRFTLENDFDVYLHDTPHKELFAKPVRSFSSGCIRVADATALAEFVLKENLYWPRDKIEEAMAGDHTFVVHLVRPVAVQVAYWTAFVEDDGTMEFRDDIYGRDRDLARLLGLREAP
jgi:murein L,D-transpeptidase YcbB/YkuD